MPKNPTKHPFNRIKQQLIDAVKQYQPRPKRGAAPEMNYVF